MALNLEELKKNHKTNYLAGVLEHLINEEKEVREMLSKDISLKEMVESEIKIIEDKIKEIQRRIRIAEMKPKHMLFTNANGIHASTNKLRTMSFH